MTAVEAARILVVEDNRDTSALLHDLLEAEGYHVDSAPTGEAAFEQLDAEPDIDLLVLDLMLPGMSGIELLRELRKSSQVPVLVLTALGDEVDRIAGLEIGADDYLPKTFSTRELLARLRAVLRRSAITAAQRDAARPAPISVGPLWMDPAARTATLDEAPLALTRVEYDLLLSLARAPGRVRTREQLLLDAADRDFEAFDRSIDVHISALRRKLGDDSRAPRLIETVRGVGYRMHKPGEGVWS